MLKRLTAISSYVIFKRIFKTNPALPIERVVLSEDKHFLIYMSLKKRSGFRQSVRQGPLQFLVRPM